MDVGEADMSSETVKRLAPKPETLRELFLKSGNLCAFPGCAQLMMNAEGVFVGQVCHIEAAEEGGERFNAAMSNEQRRQAANLMLMCYPHHQVTNDVAKFPAETLRQMKRDHETRFARPDRAILEKLTDWTDADEPSEVRNLMRLNDVLGWKQTKEELAEAVEELNAFIARLRNVPVEVRRFMGALATRAQKMNKTRAVQSSMFGTKILASDLLSAFQVEREWLVERVSQIESYGLGDVDEIDTDLGPQPAVRIANLKSGWPIWLDLVAFCEKAAEPIAAFTDDLDFARLDG